MCVCVYKHVEVKPRNRFLLKGMFCYAFTFCCLFGVSALIVNGLRSLMILLLT